MQRLVTHIVRKWALKEKLSDITLDLLSLSEIDLAKAITANVLYVLNEEINEILEEISDE